MKPPPTPTAPTARLIKVVERKASSWPTFSQLDGEGGIMVESRSEIRQVDASSTASSPPPSPHTPVKAKFCWTMSCYNPNTGSPSTCRHLFRGLPRQLHTPAGVLQEWIRHVLVYCHSPKVVFFNALVCERLPYEIKIYKKKTQTFSAHFFFKFKERSLF